MEKRYPAENKQVDIVILAAGKGSRMNAARNKMFMEINRVPLLYRTLYRLNGMELIKRIIVVVREEETDDLRSMLKKHGELKKIAKIIMGGDQRYDSVRNGLKYVYENPCSDVVMTHDGARPFVTEKLIQCLADNTEENGIVIPVLNVTETVRQIDEKSATQVLNRDQIFLTQTPQAFRAADIKHCFLVEEQRKFNATDEAGYFEQLGFPVVPVAGEKWNIKVTTPEDLSWSEFLLNKYETIRLEAFDEK